MTELPLQNKHIYLTPVTVLCGIYALMFLAFVPGIPGLQLITGAAFLLTISYALGKRFFSYLHPELSLLLGFVSFLSYISILGTLFFYLDLPLYLSMYLLTMASPLLLIGLKTMSFEFRRIGFVKQVSVHGLFLKIGYFLLIGSILTILIKSRSFDGGVSPWPLLHGNVFLLLFSAVAALLALLLTKKVRSWFVVVPLFFIVLAVATIVFPLGYGFDPFIHQATERLLLATGSISPKPYYYVGYYMLVAWSRIFLGLGIGTLDTWITVILAALCIPLAISASFRYLVVERKYSLFLPLAFLILPYGGLVQSTPQALAFVWSIIIILISALYLSTALIPSWVLVLLALAAITFHPLAGFPVVLFVVSICIMKTPRSKIKARMIAIASIILGLMAMPIAFLLIGSLSSELSVTIHAPSIAGLDFPLLGSLYRYIRLDDLIYSFMNNIQFAYGALAVYGFFSLDGERRKNFVPFMIASAILFCDYLFLQSTYQFNFITPGEQSTFALRLLTMSLYFLLPLTLFGVHHLARRILHTHFFVIVAGVLLMSACITIAWYASYPRFDSKEHSKAQAASQTDYEAVHWVDTDAQTEPYIVLADQTVSSVAVKEFGFAHYYRGFFFYPLPTNGPLYQNFLQMTDKDESTKAVLDSVFKKTGVRKIYFILNSYWDNAEIIADARSIDAIGKKILGNGNATVLSFEAK